MKTKTNRKQYGLFYKSQGHWVGPYDNTIGTKNEITQINNLVKPVLKSKTEIRKVKFAK
jgi:hypothetical protein